MEKKHFLGGGTILTCLENIQESFKSKDYIRKLNYIFCRINMMISYRSLLISDKEVNLNFRSKQDRGKPRDLFHSIRYGTNGSGRSPKNAYWYKPKSANGPKL